MSKPTVKKGPKFKTEQEALAELERWIRLVTKDSKLYVGLYDAIEDLDQTRAHLTGQASPSDAVTSLTNILRKAGAVPYLHAPDCAMWTEARICDKKCGPSTPGVDPGTK